ncbi:MAG: hypothetical protein IKG93_13410 [Clostridiales bacterium]|nr:hypothetical protein [Clostridiales bacterium]
MIEKKQTQVIQNKVSMDGLLQRRSGIEHYASIISKVWKVDISTDVAFQKEFTYFFRVRRNENWRNVFYKLFEECKSVKELSFEKVLREIYRLTGRIEASFSSKLVATLNPEMPIWDSIVLSKLQMKAPIGKDKELRLEKTIKLYADIVGWYSTFMKTDNAKKWIAEFDKTFPEFVGITEVKKIDFMLWGN